MKARLIVTYKCPKNCAGCCNKGWAYEPAKPIQHFDFEEVIITGGEPLLFVDKVIDLTKRIRNESKAKIFLYTASVRGLMDVLPYVDGICLTLHDVDDVNKFNSFIFKEGEVLESCGKSLRLNIFREALDRKVVYDSSIFKVKKDIEWLKDCPLPEGEELFELPELF